MIVSKCFILREQSTASATITQSLAPVVISFVLIDESDSFVIEYFLGVALLRSFVL